jgi:hypothetical protein
MDLLLSAIQNSCRTRKWERFWLRVWFGRGILLNPRATACSSTFPAHAAHNLAIQASKWSLEISVPRTGIDSVLKSDNKFCSPRGTALWIPRELHNSQSRGTVKYGRESRGTGNQKWLAGKDHQQFTDRRIPMCQFRYGHGSRQGPKPRTTVLARASLNLLLRYAVSFTLYLTLKETQTEGVWEQGAEENIWTEERWSDGRLEKTA